MAGNFEGQIFNLQSDKAAVESAGKLGEQITYKIGFRDCRHKASEIGAQADMEIRQLKVDIRRLEDQLQERLHES